MRGAPSDDFEYNLYSPWDDFVLYVQYVAPLGLMLNAVYNIWRLLSRNKIAESFTPNALQEINLQKASHQTRSKK